MERHREEGFEPLDEVVRGAAHEASVMVMVSPDPSAAVRIAL